MADWRQTLQAYRQKFLELPLQKKLLILAIPLSAVLLLLVLTIYATSPNYGVLYTGLSQEDMQAVLLELDKEGVKYKVGQDGKSVMVPENMVADLRLKLAAKGIPNKGIVGYEVFDKTSFAVSDFQQQVNFKRAVEGELARTILKISSIEDARVNIALPEKSIFVRDEEEPSASVFVKLKPGQELTAEQVKAIRNLVSASVPKLKPQSVVVVDDKGRDLTALLDEESAKVGERELKLKLEFERSLEKKIQTALESALGYGKVKVKVSADLDFSKVKQKEELYDPDMTAVVSQQKKKERTQSTGPAGVPGAQANIPPGAGLGAGGQLISEKSETITNYEVSKRETYTEGPDFKVKRLSVGVMLDANLKDVDINKIRNIVIASAGVDLQRGDVVSVEALPFKAVALPEEKPPYIDYIKYGLLGILALGTFMVLFILLRKMKRKPPPLPAPVVTQPPPPMEALEEVKGIEEIRLKAKEMVTVEAVAKVSKQDPEKVARIIKSWLRSKT